MNDYSCKREKLRGNQHEEIINCTQTLPINYAKYYGIFTVYIWGLASYILHYTYVSPSLFTRKCCIALHVSLYNITLFTGMLVVIFT